MTTPDQPTYAAPSYTYDAALEAVLVPLADRAIAAERQAATDAANAAAAARRARVRALLSS